MLLRQCDLSEASFPFFETPRYRSYPITVKPAVWPGRLVQIGGSPALQSARRMRPPGHSAGRRLTNVRRTDGLPPGMVRENLFCARGRTRGGGASPLPWAPLNHYPAGLQGQGSGLGQRKLQRCSERRGGAHTQMRTLRVQSFFDAAVVHFWCLCLQDWQVSARICVCASAARQPPCTRAQRCGGGGVRMAADTEPEPQTGHTACGSNHRWPDSS